MYSRHRRLRAVSDEIDTPIVHDCEHRKQCNINGPRNANIIKIHDHDHYHYHYHYHDYYDYYDYHYDYVHYDDYYHYCCYYYYYYDY